MPGTKLAHSCCELAHCRGRLWGGDAESWRRAQGLAGQFLLIILPGDEAGVVPPASGARRTQAAAAIDAGERALGGALGRPAASQCGHRMRRHVIATDAMDADGLCRAFA